MENFEYEMSKKIERNFTNRPALEPPDFFCTEGGKPKVYCENGFDIK